MGEPADNDRVRRLLRKAFPNGIFPTTPNRGGKVRSRHRWLLWRVNLPLFQEWVIVRILPGVLDDLIVKHDDEDGEMGDMVIYFLDVVGEPGTSWKRRDQRTIYFTHFTQQQAHAIAEWLSLAKAWTTESIVFADMEDDIERARRYWSERAARQAEPSANSY